MKVSSLVGQAVAVKELLRRPDVEVNGVEPDDGQTALFLASRFGHEAVVRVLLACAEVEANYEVTAIPAEVKAIPDDPIEYPG